MLQMHRNGGAVILPVGRSSLVIANLFGFAATPTPCVADGFLASSAAPPTIVIYDASTGCFHHQVKQTAYVLNGTDYIGPAARFPKSYIDGLRSLVLASHEDASGLLAQLGVTADTIKEHRDDIFRALRFNTPELPDEMPTWAEPLISDHEVLDILFREIAGGELASTTHVEFRVTLPGDPPVTIASEVDRRWMLPWTITTPEATWSSYSLAVSRALAVLSDPTGPNAAQLDGAWYWSSAVWGDSILWHLSPIGESINATFSTQIAKTLAGYASCEEQFMLRSAEIAYVFPGPRALYMELDATHPLLVNATVWWNPIEKDRPTRDWNDFLALHKRCTDAATPHAWLADWKGASLGREICLYAVGTTGFSESSMDYEVLPTWQSLGLAGRPDFELRLFGGASAAIFLSRQDPRALIMRARGLACNHWPDPLNIDSPYCAVVDREGHAETHRVTTIAKP